MKWNGQAKPETVDKVCSIVRKQLALPESSELTPESKFSALGADSLDTVRLFHNLPQTKHHTNLLHTSVSLIINNYGSVHCPI